MATVLVIDDDRLICTLLREVLRGRGHEVVVATDGERGIEKFLECRPKLTVLDLGMPGVNGIEVLKRIRAADPTAIVLILTGAGLKDLEAEARAIGVTDVFYKGTSLTLLTAALDRLSKPQPVAPPSP
ncbi:response regulator [Candidatus Nitrospira bockiana]